MGRELHIINYPMSCSNVTYHCSAALPAVSRPSYLRTVSTHLSLANFSSPFSVKEGLVFWPILVPPSEHSPEIYAESVWFPWEAQTTFFLPGNPLSVSRISQIEPESADTYCISYGEPQWPTAR